MRSIREECLDRVIPPGERPFGAPSPSSWRTTTASETIKGWATSSSIVRHGRVPVQFVDGSVSVDFSVTTVPRHSGAEPVLRHYGLPSAAGEFPRTRIESNRQDLRFYGIAKKGDRPSQHIRNQVPREMQHSSYVLGG